MVHGITRSDKEYRKLPFDSSSSLKEFSLDRKKYQKRYILGEDIIEEDSKASIIGKLVETLLLEEEQFDNRFYLSACLNTPTGLGLAFCESLWRYTKEATDEEGNVTRTFAEISQDAYTESGYKIPYDTVMKKFLGSELEIYYDEIRNVRSKGLTVVTAKDVTNAENIVAELKNNEFTKDIINLVSSSRYDVRNQLQVEGFTIDKHPMKAMMDLLIVDHQKQTISVYDLKVTWEVERFYESYFLYRLAYIQAFVYYGAALYLTKTEEDLKDYKVIPMQFIVCDSSNYYAPLIYQMTEADLEDAYNGFSYKGKYYPGVKTIISDLKWALSENIWNISKTNYGLRGVVPLRD